MPTLPYDIIRYKKDGRTVGSRDLKKFVQGYVDGTVADYQMSAWLMAVCFNGLADDELIAYTEALIDSGERIDLSDIPGFKVDKHSTGGVGDKVSLVLAPLVAACGIPVPMVSGRGLAHTGGTLDKLASIPGFRTDLSTEEFKWYLSEIGVAMMGQTQGMCPADGKIYALRDVTSTVESIDLIAASISAKKIAEGTQGLVLDVKVGSGAFMKDEGKAEKLASRIISLTKGFGVKTSAVLTNMNQPLGVMVGNALEVREAIACLKGKGPDDLRELVIALAVEMLALAGWKDTKESRALVEKVLDSGDALDKFMKMVKIQGGNPGIVEDTTKIPEANYKIPVKAAESGKILGIDTYHVGMLAVKLGAGRARKEDEIDPAVGFEFLRKTGEEIRDGEELALIHTNDDNKGLETAIQLRECFEVGHGDRFSPPLILNYIR